MDNSLEEDGKIGLRFRKCNCSQITTCYAEYNMHRRTNRRAVWIQTHVPIMFQRPTKIEQ